MIAAASRRFLLDESSQTPFPFQPGEIGSLLVTTTSPNLTFLKLHEYVGILKSEVDIDYAKGFLIPIGLPLLCGTVAGGLKRVAKIRRST